MAIRQTITGTYTREQLGKLSWPIAWSVGEEQRAEEEETLRALVEDAKRALDADLDAAAVEICNGKIVALVAAEEV